MIPFQLPDIGFREISGKLYLDDEFLVFEVQDALMGEFDIEQQVIKVELGAIKEMRLERRFIRDRLYIWPKNRELLKVMPGKYLGELCLKIWSKHRGEIERLLEDVERRQEQEQ